MSGYPNQPGGGYGGGYYYPQQQPPYPYAPPVPPQVQPYSPAAAAYTPAPAPAPAPELQGTPFGPYVLQSELGRGGMGIVYKAFHRELKRQCAIKTMITQGADDEAKQRFVREGQSSAKLGKHPNIVQVFDAGIQDGVPYIAMEFVVGTPLDARLEKAPLPVKEALEIGRKVALALDHAHGCGIVHRDMKPQNVIVDKSGEPQILDFGLAKDMAASSQISQANAIMGTPAYMSPEQAQPGRLAVDRRSDVYSLAATLHHCLSGKPPFGGDDAVQTIVQVVFSDPPPLSKLHGIDSDVEAIVEKGMDKEPERRYQTALEMADDISRVLNGEEPRARPVGTIGRLIRRARRNRGVVAASIVALCLFGVLALWAAWKTAAAGQAILRRTRAAGIIGSLYGNESAEEKIEAFTKVVEADPTWDRGYFQLGVAYLDRALELDAEDLEAAKVHRQTAVRVLTDGIEQGLGALGHYQRGNSYEEMYDARRMREDFRMAAFLEPESRIGLEAGCALALAELRFEAAEQLGTRVLELAPDSDITHWRRGEARLALGNLEGAYEDAVRARELWDAEPEYFLLAARVALAQGRLDLYGKHVLEAIAVNEDQPRVVAQLALDALRRGDLARAVRLADEAVRQDGRRPVVAENDRDPLVYVVRGRTRLAAGKTREARGDFEIALQLDPLVHDAVRDLDGLDGKIPPPPKEAKPPEIVAAARDALERGSLEEAHKLAMRALQADPDEVGAFDVAVRIEILRGKAASAARFLGGGTPALRALRAWAHERAGEMELAAKYAEAALAGKEQPPLALRVRARARIDRGDEEMALVDVQRALRADPLDVDGLEIRARCFNAIRDLQGEKDTRERIALLRRETR